MDSQQIMTVNDVNLFATLVAIVVGVMLYVLALLPAIQHDKEVERQREIQELRGYFDKETNGEKDGDQDTR